MQIKNLLEPASHLDTILGVPLAARNVDEARSFKHAMAFDAYDMFLGFMGVIKDLDEQMKSPQLMRATRDRLKKMRGDYETHASTMRALLKPLGFESIKATDYNQYVAQRGRGHRLAAHYDNLFKDWAWGEKENAEAIALVKKVAGQVGKPRKILNLGAGACRLPYEIHRWLEPELSVCVDINPLLLSCAQRIVRGEKMKLVEFPIIPVSAQDFTVVSELKSPAPVTQSMEFLVHDLNHWLFAKESFDLVVTPWFLDVSPIPAPKLMAQINSVLKPGGHWLNFGPVGFNTVDFARYYSREEIPYLAQKSGFEMLAQEFEPLPYFQNPRSSHWRTERVLAFTAQKIADAELPSEAELSNLPEWVTDTTKPVQAAFNLEEIRMSMAFTADLAARVKPGKSVRDLAQELSGPHGLAADQAEYLIRTMLFQWQLQNRTNPMK